MIKMDRDLIFFTAMSFFLIFSGFACKNRKIYIWCFQFYGYKMTKEEKEKPSKKQIIHARLLSNLLLGLGFPLLAGNLFYYFFNNFFHFLNLHFFITFQCIVIVIWVIIFVIVSYKNKDVLIYSLKSYGPRNKSEFYRETE